MGLNSPSDVGVEPGFKLTACSGMAWCFVLADVEDTAATFKERFHAKRWVKNIGDASVPVAGCYFVPFQINGNPWTNLAGMLESDSGGLSPSLMMALSKQLSTRCVFAAYEDTASVFLYILFESGTIAEFLHSDGSSKLHVISKAPAVPNTDALQVPHGFCFYSKLRKLRPKDLTGSNVVEFFDSFLRTQRISLVTEFGHSADGSFSLQRNLSGNLFIGRADLVGLLAEQEVSETQKWERLESQINHAVEVCNRAHFYAYKAREEYKEWKSMRPTRAECQEHQEQHLKVVGRVRKLLRRIAQPCDRWLLCSARAGNAPLVEVLLNSGLYSSNPVALRQAAEEATSKNETIVVNLLAAALKGK